MVNNNLWGTNGRWKNHIYKALKKKLYKGETENSGSCRYLDSAIRKYGPDNFKVEVLIVCNKSLLNMYETKFISLYNTLSPNGYNLTEGGESRKWSEESKKLMSEKMKILGGHSQTQETKEKISKTLKELHGKTISERNKLKIGIPQPKQPRKNPEDINLPKYISRLNRKGILVGYTVCGHPSQNKKKTFSSSKRTLEDNLNLAIEYLETLK
jgi:group I intron endonuclease